MLQSLIGKIDKLDAKDAEVLAEQIDKYPYCQCVQLLYTVALANIHSTQFHEHLQKAAVTMPDRLKLCQFVSHGEFEWIALLNEIENNKLKEKKEPIDDFAIIDRYLDNLGDIPANSLPYDISSLSVSQAILDDLDDDNDTKNDEQDDLINSFIEEEERGELFVTKVTSLDDSEYEEDDVLALKKIREKAFLSESLAKIYVKQHKYEQAIAIFSSLNLKYSKKYTYFADQIRYLETILSYLKGEENNKENQ